MSAVFKKKRKRFITITCNSQWSFHLREMCLTNWIKIFLWQRDNCLVLMLQIFMRHPHIGNIYYELLIATGHYSLYIGPNDRNIICWRMDSLRIGGMLLNRNSVTDTFICLIQGSWRGPPTCHVYHSSNTWMYSPTWCLMTSVWELSGTIESWESSSWWSMDTSPDSRPSVMKTHQVTLP